MIGYKNASHHQRRGFGFLEHFLSLPLPSPFHDVRTIIAMSADEKIDVSEKQAVVGSDVDSEANQPVASGHTLHRTMKNRHIAMIRCVLYISSRQQ